MQIFLAIHLNFISGIVAGKCGAKFLLKYLTVILVRVAGKIGADLFGHLSLFIWVIVAGKSGAKFLLKYLIVNLGRVAGKIGANLSAKFLFKYLIHFGQDSRKDWCRSF